MEQLPDAPWIRDAELNGMPGDDPVKCPLCGKECEEIYTDNSGDAVGCDKCIHMYDAYDWKLLMKADGRW